VDARQVWYVNLSSIIQRRNCSKLQPRNQRAVPPSERDAGNGKKERFEEFLRAVGASAVSASGLEVNTSNRQTCGRLETS